MKYTTALTILFSILLWGCDNQVEIIRSKHYNGQIEEILILTKPISRDSVGISTTFYENGPIHCQGKLINGQRNGEWICYYPNGEIEWKSSFKNGVEDGELFCNYPNGTWKKVFCKNGIKEGKTIEYNLDDKNHQFFYVYGQYKDNKEDGLWVKKDASGILLIEMTFKEGKRLGYFSNYYSNGKLRVKGEFGVDERVICNEVYDEKGNKIVIKGNYNIYSI